MHHEIELPTLRDYQTRDMAAVSEHFRAGANPVLLVEPTGAGKGTQCTWMVARAVRNGKRVCFLVNRRALVADMSKRLSRLQIPHGVLMGAQTRGTHHSVIVASIDTLGRRDTLPPADLVIVDEAHFSISESWEKIIARYLDAGAKILGMTATPVRLDGRGLGNIYRAMVVGPSVGDLIERGYLVRPRVYAPSIPDLTGIHNTGGDYNQKELAEKLNTPRLVGDIVEHWQRLSGGRPTIGFAVDRHHSESISEAFRNAGIPALSVDGDDSDKEREHAWAGLRAGSIKVVMSVMIVSYGWDEPIVSHSIWARPTQSLALCLQQGGRVLRPYPGKEFASVQDHAGNTLRHGFLDDEREWTLENVKRKRNGGNDERTHEVLPLVCPRCMRVCSPTTKQCACNYVFPKTETNAPTHVDGELIEVTKRTLYPRAEYERFGLIDDPAIQAIITRAHERGHKPYSVKFCVDALHEARAKYRDVTGREPQSKWGSAVLNAMIERHSLQKKFA